MAQPLREHTALAEACDLHNNANTKQFLTTCNSRSRISSDISRYLHSYTHIHTHRYTEVHTIKNKINIKTNKSRLKNLNNLSKM